MFEELDLPKGLGEDVSGVVMSRNRKDLDLARPRQAPWNVEASTRGQEPLDRPVGVPFVPCGKDEKGRELNRGARSGEYFVPGMVSVCAECVRSDSRSRRGCARACGGEP